MFLHAWRLDAAASARAAYAGRSSRRFPADLAQFLARLDASGATACLSPPRRFRLLVFDWDGTLADSTALIAGAHPAGLPRSRRRRARRGRRRGTSSGSGIRDAIRYVAPTLGRAALRAFRRALSRSHYMLGDAAIPLFDGVRDMLAELDGARIPARHRHRQVAARARRASSRSMASRDHFDASRCADEGFPSRIRTCCWRSWTRPTSRASADADDRRHDARSAACAQRRRGGAGGDLRRALHRRDWPGLRRWRRCIRSRSCAHGWRRTRDLRQRRADRGGPACAFEVVRGERTLPAFAMRFAGRVHAYVNECRHQATELDWDAGDFFDARQAILGLRDARRALRSRDRRLRRRAVSAEHGSRRSTVHERDGADLLHED